MKEIEALIIGEDLNFPVIYLLMWQYFFTNKKRKQEPGFAAVVKQHSFKQCSIIAIGSYWMVLLYFCQNNLMVGIATVLFFTALNPNPRNNTQSTISHLSSAHVPICSLFSLPHWLSIFFSLSIFRSPSPFSLWHFLCSPSLSPFWFHQISLNNIWLELQWHRRRLWLGQWWRWWDLRVTTAIMMMRPVVRTTTTTLFVGKGWWTKGVQVGRTVLDLRAMVAVIKHMKVCRHPLLPRTIFHGLLAESASTWVLRHIYTKTKEKNQWNIHLGILSNTLSGKDKTITPCVNSTSTQPYYT